MNAHHNNTNKHSNQPNDGERAESQMLQILEDFLLLADPDTIRALDDHLRAGETDLRADQLVRELGRLVTKAHRAGDSDD